ncbi:MAG: SLC13/DASS family transporter [Roseburia sp.]|nr:SLC13/DASS family transporter [Roseburia sp.]
MSQSTITLIIIACTCILYLTEKFSVAVTTVLGMLALIFTGILDFNEAFACFTSTNVMLVLGMIIIVESLLDSGIAGKLGGLLFRLVGKSEKSFLIVVFVSAAFFSLFSTNAALVAMYMPLISAVSGASKGRIRKKHIYLPLAMGGLIGGTGSLAGSTAPLLANDVLELTGSKTMSFFTPLPISAIMVIVIALCYWFFLYDLQVKCFDFEETSAVEEMEDYPLNKKKAAISLTVFLTCIILFIVQPFDWELGLIAVAGAMVLMITGCVDGQHAMSNMQWSALVTLGAALAVAKGFVKSGVGEIVMDWLMVTLGSWVANPIILVTVFLLSGFLLSQFMSNGSLVSMLAAIGVPMAIEIGCDPMPVALSCVFGCSLAMATPVATTTITMVQVAGYRFKDYFRIGGLVGLIGLFTAWVSIILIYGLI